MIIKLWIRITRERVGLKNRYNQLETVRKYNGNIIMGVDIKMGWIENGVP